MSKISVVGCEDYSPDRVQAAVDAAFENLGGIDKFVSKGDRVFLKINLVIKKHPDEAATTHPALIEAVAKRLMEAGARVIIGDSPGGPYTRGILQSFYKVCGIDEAANSAGAELNYDCSYEEYENPSGVVAKRLKLIKPMMDCDKIITITKLKTHGMTLYTGAVKIMFGAIPGVFKAEYHFKMQDIKDFSNLLVDICARTKPVLSIIDGIVGMEGDGPTAGTPVKSNVLIASSNPYDLDVAGAYLMGVQPRSVPTIQRCIERGLTTGNLKDIEIIGDNIDKYRKQYKIPDTRTINFSNRIPGFIRNFLRRNVLPRPVFSQEICIGCGRCKQSCPPGAIAMKNGRPAVDINKCIRCFCCQELCPQKAVQIKRPWILRKALR